MAIEQLLVRLRLESGQYKTEAKQAAAATDAIGTSAKGAATGWDKAARGIGVSTATLKVGLGAAAVGVGAVVSQSIQAASNLGESINAVNVTFGEAAEGVLALGESSVESFGMSQRAFNEFSVRFSAFANTISGETGQSVVEVVEDMTTRIADFASVHNLSLEEAATIAQSTLAGETEAFRRFGGDVSAAAVEQEAWSSGIADAGEELTEQQKILARYNLFMQQTEKTAGDFAATSDQLAGSQKKLTAQWEDLTAQIGAAFIPVATAATGAVTDLLTAADEDVNLGWSQRLSLAFQTVLGESEESRQAYIDQKTEINNAADAAENFAGVLTRRGRGAQRDVRGEIEDTTDAIEDQAGAFDEDERAIDRTIRMLGDYEDAQRRLTDPVFKAIDDQRNLAEAWNDYNTAVEEFGDTSPEAIAAGLDLAAAQQSVNDATQNLPDDMQAAIDSIIILGRQAGVAEDSLAGIRAQIEGIDGQTAVARININVVGGERVHGDPRFDIVFRQHGGPLQARQPAIVGEAGPELFVPYTAGTILSNATLQNAGRAGSGGATNHFHIGAVYGWDDFVRKVNQANVDGVRLGLAN